MFKFVAGFIATSIVFTNKDKIVKRLEDVIAKLELKRDILKHDHPELRDGTDYA